MINQNTIQEITKILPRIKKNYFQVHVTFNWNYEIFKVKMIFN